LNETIENNKENVANMIKDAIQRRESELQQEHENLVEQLNQQQQSWKESINTFKSEMEATQATNAILKTQLADLQKHYEQQLESKQSEVDMLSNEVDRTSQLYQTLQAEMATNTPAKKPAKDTLTKADLELQIVQKSIEISNLQSKNEQLRAQEAYFKKDIAELSSANQSQKQQITTLQSELAAAPSPERVAKLHKRIQKLKQIIGQRDNVLWSASETDEAPRERVAHSPVFDSEDRPGSTSSLLIKTRQIENDLVQAKATIAKLLIELKQSEEKLKGANQDLDRKKLLLQQLEADFEQMRTLNMATTANTEEPAKNTEMIEMIWHQRDQFKQKIQQLEQTNSQLQATIQNQLVDVKRTKADNVKLYEKIKYLESYAASASAHKAPLRDLEKGIDTRYQTIYDENINPFVEFSKKEKLTKIQELNPIERVVYSLSKIFLATKNARLVLFAYIAILHLLVFFSLSMWTSTCPS